MRDPEEVLGFIEDFKGKSRDTESETEQEIWDVYCRLRHQFLEAIQTEPLPLSLSSSLSPLPHQASGKPCSERIIPASIKEQWRG